MSSISKPLPKPPGFGGTSISKPIPLPPSQNVYIPAANSTLPQHYGGMAPSDAYFPAKPVPVAPNPTADFNQTNPYQPGMMPVQNDTQWANYNSTQQFNQYQPNYYGNSQMNNPDLQRNFTEPTVPFQPAMQTDDVYKIKSAPVSNYGHQPSPTEFTQYKPIPPAPGGYGDARSLNNSWGSQQAAYAQQPTLHSSHDAYSSFNKPIPPAPVAERSLSSSQGSYPQQVYSSQPKPIPPAPVASNRGLNSSTGQQPMADRSMSGYSQQPNAYSSQGGGGYSSKPIPPSPVSNNERSLKTSQSNQPQYAPAPVYHDRSLNNSNSHQQQVSKPLPVPAANQQYANNERSLKSSQGSASKPLPPAPAQQQQRSNSPAFVPVPIVISSGAGAAETKRRLKESQKLAKLEELDRKETIKALREQEKQQKKLKDFQEQEAKLQQRMAKQEQRRMEEERKYQERIQQERQRAAEEERKKMLLLEEQRRLDLQRERELEEKRLAEAKKTQEEERKRVLILAEQEKQKAKDDLKLLQLQEKQQKEKQALEKKKEKQEKKNEELQRKMEKEKQQKELLEQQRQQKLLLLQQQQQLEQEKQQRKLQEKQELEKQKLEQQRLQEQQERQLAEQQRLLEQQQLLERQKQLAEQERQNQKMQEQQRRQMKNLKASNSNIATPISPREAPGPVHHVSMDRRIEDMLLPTSTIALVENKNLNKLAAMPLNIVVNSVAVKRPSDAKKTWYQLYDIQISYCKSSWTIHRVDKDIINLYLIVS